MMVLSADSCWRQSKEVDCAGERLRMRRRRERYCGRDAEGMVRIVDALRGALRSRFSQQDG